MAELNFNVNNATQINNNIQNTRTQAAKPAVQPERQQSERVKPEETQDNKAPAYENIVSVSKDGDTVQASPESMQELKDEAFGTVVERQDEDEEDKNTGFVAEDENENINSEEDVPAERNTPEVNAYDPVEENRKAAERRAEIREELRLERERAEREQAEREVEAAENAPVRVEARTEEREQMTSQQITSFAGYTDTQLRSLYLQGEITRADYDEEMQNREETKAEAIEDIQLDNEQFSKDIAAYSRIEEQNAIDETELREAFAPEANDNIEAQDRVEMITLAQNLQQERQLQDISITT